MYLYVLDAEQRDEALAFNDPQSAEHLPPGYSITPIAVRAGAPYAYAGKWVLPVGLSSNPDYAVTWNFLATLPVADIVPSEAWPPIID